MCFSAPASFTASAALLIIGVIAIRKASTTPQRVLAGVPLLFSVQQFSEGLLWLSLSAPGHEHWHHASMYIFLVFAQVIWPSYVPFFVLLPERHPIRKRILRFLLATGIGTSLYLSYCLLLYPVSAVIDGYHIRYDLDFPLGNKWHSGISYIIAAVFSPFISSSKHLRFIGALLLGSYLVTRIFYHDYLISVWCYFAAVLSLTILALIVHSNKKGIAG